MVKPILFSLLAPVFCIKAYAETPDQISALQQNMAVLAAKVEKLEEQQSMIGNFNPTVVVGSRSNKTPASTSNSSLEISKPGLYLVYATYSCSSSSNYQGQVGRYPTEKLYLNGNQIMINLDTKICHSYVNKLVDSKTSQPMTLRLKKGDQLSFGVSGWSTNLYGYAQIYAVQVGP